MLLALLLGGERLVPLAMPFIILGVAPKPFKVICGDMSFPFVIGRLRERSATIPDGTVKDKAF